MDINFDTPTISHASKMNIVLKFLEERFAINFFHFARRFNDDTHFSISTNKIWHIKYKTEYEAVDSFMDNKKIRKYTNIFLWNSEELKSKKEKQMHEERTKSFSIPPGISLIHKTENYTDTFSFSSSRIFQDRINILLNEALSLFDFGFKFSKDMEQIIIDYTKKQILQIKQIKLKPVIPINIDTHTKILDNEINIINKFNKKLFTTRQIECIYCASQGLNSQQTGNVLLISRRTVESLLNESMLKIGGNNRCHLIYLSTKYGLIKEDLISPELKNKVKTELNKFI